jgi:hypothetical protein
MVDELHGFDIWLWRAFIIRLFKKIGRAYMSFELLSKMMSKPYRPSVILYVSGTPSLIFNAEVIETAQIFP